MEELQRGRGTMPRPSYVDSDGLTPLQASRQRELVGNAQRLYSTLSARRQQQLAETIGMMSPAILPEPPGRRSSIPPRRSVDAYLEPLPRTLLASSPQLANLVKFENLYISISALGETVPRPGERASGECGGWSWFQENWTRGLVPRACGWSSAWR